MCFQKQGFLKDTRIIFSFFAVCIKLHLDGEPLTTSELTLLLTRKEMLRTQAQFSNLRSPFWWISFSQQTPVI